MVCRVSHVHREAHYVLLKPNPEGVAMNLVLIVSYENDQHAQHLIKRSEELGVKAELWDVSDFPNNTEISLTLSESGLACDFFHDRVVGIYWRRANGGYRQNTRTLMQQYIHLESEVVIRSLFDFFPDINWISSPEPDRLACRKPVQLKLAQSLGLRIPQSCITNSPDRAREFLESLQGKPVTMKPVGTAFMQLAKDGNLESNENKVVFTKLIDLQLILENIEMVKNCPVIFQEAVMKDFDLRITVVDTQVFAAEVKIEGCSDPANLDWRNYEGKRSYARHNLPDEVRGLCLALVNGLGLRFGCIDMAYSPKEGYTFFEINPQGQWLPSETKLGYDISGAILKSLVS